MTPSSDLITCCKGSQNPGKHFPCYCQFIVNNIRKDASEQPDKEVYRARSGGWGGGPEHRSFHPCGVWGAPSFLHNDGLPISDSL